MLLATILLLCPLPQSGDIAKTDSERAIVVSTDATKDSSSSKALPSTPEPKVKGDAELGVTPAAAPVTPASSPMVVKPAVMGRGYEDAKQKKEWYALTIASSGAAVFDAWSTRRAISGGYGTEANPLLRPFSHSNAMYAATQVSPLVMDLIGRKMMTSRHPLLRRLWWLPQSAGMTTSVMAGINNVTIVH